MLSEDSVAESRRAVIRNPAQVLTGLLFETILPTVLARARQLLKLLEGEQLAAGKNRAATNDDRHGQLALFATAPNPLVARLAALDTDDMTPLQGLSVLADLSREAKQS